MILPDLILPSRVNQTWLDSGIDAIGSCLDKKHFQNYPHKISYNYNSRGFRDQEWPESIDDLRQAVWCIGDSFTVGHGSPITHTWPTRLSSTIGRRVINISMDGASNDWIARRAHEIARALNPVNMVIMWSYFHRRESNKQLLDDEKRRLHFDRRSVAHDNNDRQDWENFLKCKQLVDQAHVDAIHLLIPDVVIPNGQAIWNQVRGADWSVTVPMSLQELYNLPVFILNELRDVHRCLDILQFAIILKPAAICNVEKLDLARDGYHFDLVTAEWVANYVANRLTRQ